MTSESNIQSASFAKDGNRALVFPEAFSLGKEAALFLAAKIKQFPDAVVVLPTGVTPLPFYDAFINLFAEDNSLNLAEVVFFNLDEYVGLSKDHPLSYNFYMRNVLYAKLQDINLARAPKDSNIHIPHVPENTNPIKAALDYEKLFNESILKTGRGKADIAFLGIGGISPVKDSSGEILYYKGAHIGFNEPGTPHEYGTHLVRLTEKTRKDTLFRFLNLNDRNKDESRFSETVPEFALTMGIANIINCEHIVVMATGESKASVVREIFNAGFDNNLTASVLLKQGNVSWLFDSDASFLLPAFVQKIKRGFEHCDFTDVWTDVFREIAISKSENNTEDVLSDIADSLGIAHDFILEGKKYFKTKIADTGDVGAGLLPFNSTVLISSPHPDDDVISMGATISYLKQRGNNVKVAYMVTGENSVRETDFVPSLKIEKKHKIFMQQNGRSPDYLESRQIGKEAKIETRKEEAVEALSVFEIASDDVIFLECDYYNLRGFVDIDPLSEKDKNSIIKLFADVKPNNVFYSAEHDPNGAHGLGARLIQYAASKMVDKKDVKFYGYCGAYKEWNLAYTKSFVIVPFSSEVWEKKKESILCHKSQILPEFSGGDDRPFYERVSHRNLATAHLMHLLGLAKEYPMAEVFRIFTVDEFLNHKY